MNRTIGIVSAKGGVGKTVVAVNLGLALYNLDQEIIVVDADTTASNLGLQLGIYSFPITLQDVLIGKTKINNAVYTSHIGLKIIPSSISLGSLGTDIFRLKRALKKLEGTVLVDSPPGLSEDALAVLNACNEIIIVATPEIPTMANAVKVIRVARKKKKSILGIIVNRYSKDGYELDPEEIEIMSEVPILGKIPEDHHIRKSIFKKAPLLIYNPFSPAAIEINKIAHELLEKPYTPPKFLFLKRLAKRVGLGGDKD